MAIEVKIPAVGESITSGIVSVWHKKSGEFVNEGEPLFTLETDKVSTEIVAEKAGVLETKVPEGREVKIGELVATIDDSKSAGAKKEEKPKKKAPEEKKKEPAREQEPAAVATDVERGGPGSTPPATALSPAVRRIVEEDKLQPEKIRGTGPGGRMTKGDALKAAEQGSKAEPVGQAVSFPRTTAPPPAAGEPSADGRFIRKRMSPLRRKIAQQLVMAQHTAAILTTFNECDMSAVQELRRKAQDEFTKKNGIKLGLMSFFIKACVDALKAVPVVNGRIEDDDFIQNNFYDIGVAVGTERGLVVPVVRDADKKSFAQLERDIADYAARARDGKLKIEDLQGGTFTITNGGVYGSLFATPILNPPQSGILGIHKIMPRPMAMDGKVEVRPMMYLALSYDHRAIDGKEGVTFLIKVKECIEDPKRLPLDF
ncbi:MAG TPA: 2-oxoglutarate dehydrogenase complex dihydrolipoyllysine-residue succinyltransferase [Candidatus Udaeobacter sp.]|jgi:2-oxoglutarate dehydrogenase E2 component (dihydrolipoamide succinyltransferase)|nr:2-oxoglutarate dehydrogenase complex dihydrolipoyllysine-residue succinyltransferase [Candidatus Udaeobacter sp.]